MPSSHLSASPSPSLQHPLPVEHSFFLLPVTLPFPSKPSTIQENRYLRQPFISNPNPTCPVLSKTTFSIFHSIYYTLPHILHIHTSLNHLSQGLIIVIAPSMPKRFFHLHRQHPHIRFVLHSRQTIKKQTILHT